MHSLKLPWQTCVFSVCVSRVRRSGSHGPCPGVCSCVCTEYTHVSGSRSVLLRVGHVGLHLAAALCLQAEDSAPAGHLHPAVHSQPSRWFWSRGQEGTELSWCFRPSHWKDPGLPPNSVFGSCRPRRFPVARLRCLGHHLGWNRVWVSPALQGKLCSRASGLCPATPCLPPFSTPWWGGGCCCCPRAAGRSRHSCPTPSPCLAAWLSYSAVPGIQRL